MDTHNELMGYVGECYFCGEGIMEWEKYGHLFHGYAHEECVAEYDADQEALAEQGD